MPTIKGQDDLYIFTPPPGLFRNYSPSVIHQVGRETQSIPIFQGVHYPKEGGMFTKYLGALYMEKGIKCPEPGQAIAISKRMLLGMLSIPSSTRWIVLPLIGLALVPWKAKIQIVDSLLLRLIQSTDRNLERFYMHKRFYSAPMRELRTLFYLFLKNLGFPQWTCSRISEILIAFPQWDDQYRYREQDIFTMADKQRLMDNPRKELLYLYKIYMQREIPGMNKLDKVIKFLSLAMLVPRIKKAFQEAVRLTDIDKIKMDDADMYFTLCMGPYKFMGVSLTLRKHAYWKMHNGQIPPWIKVSYG